MFLKQQHIVLAQPSPLSATALLRGSCFEVPLFLRRDHWVVGVLRVGSTFQFFTSGLLGRNKKTFRFSILPRSHHPLLPSVRRGDAFNPFLRFFSAKDAGLLLVCRCLQRRLFFVRGSSSLSHCLQSFCLSSQEECPFVD